MFCFVLFCFVLFCFVLFCFVLFCFVLFCFVLFCFVLFCFVLFCFVLFCFVLFCFVLFCFLFCFVLFIIVAIYCLDVSREIVFSTSYRALEFSVTVIFFLQKYFAEKLKKVQLSQRNLFLPLATRMNVQHYVISENLAAAAGEKLSGNQPLNSQKRAGSLP